MTEEFPRLRNESQEKRDVEAKERGEQTGVLYHSVRPFTHTIMVYTRLSPGYYAGSGTCPGTCG